MRKHARRNAQLPSPTPMPMMSSGDFESLVWLVYGCSVDDGVDAEVVDWVLDRSELALDRALEVDFVEDILVGEWIMDVFSEDQRFDVEIFGPSDIGCRLELLSVGPAL